MPRHKPPAENLLIVEGKDDLHVVSHLFKQNQLPETFAVEIGGLDDKDEEGGYDLLRREVRRRLERRDHKRLGILVDADTDITARWQSLRDMLTEIGYSQTPLLLRPSGEVIPPDDPEPLDAAQPPYKTVVGVWLMPNNTLPGALENFVRFLVPAEKEAMWGHAEASVAYLPTKPEPLTDNWRAKACIHTYLAWQKEPGSPMGLAITKKYLTVEAEVVAPFLDWIRRLFEIAP